MTPTTSTTPVTPTTVLLSGSEAGRARRSGLMSLAEYVHHTGLSVEAVAQLEDMGLVGARAADAEGAVKERETGGRPPGLYDAPDLRAGWALKTLLDSGFGPEDLEFSRAASCLGSRGHRFRPPQVASHQLSIDLPCLQRETEGSTL